MKAQQASSTARVIAASTLLLASDRRTAPLVAPGAADLCDLFLSTCQGDRLLAASARLPLTRAVWRTVERLTLPGITAHYWRRKQWLESWCRAAIAEGFDRLVVIGAGFDTLGMRLAQEHAGLEVVEIDHPATQRRKVWALTAGDARIPANLRFVPCDLASETLPRTPFGPGPATLVVMEGVLMYLDTDDVDRLFQALRHSGARPLRLAFTAMATWPDGTAGFRPRSWLVDRWLALHGEPFRWSLAPESTQEFLEARGFRLARLVQARELAGGASPQPVLEGENLVSCEAR